MDHLVRSGQQRFRDGEAERFGSLEVNDEFELARLNDRQVCRLLTLENSPRIDANLVERIAVAAVAHQTASEGEIR